MPLMHSFESIAHRLAPDGRIGFERTYLANGFAKCFTDGRKQQTTSEEIHNEGRSPATCLT